MFYKKKESYNVFCYFSLLPSVWTFDGGGGGSGVGTLTVRPASMYVYRAI